MDVRRNDKGEIQITMPDDEARLLAEHMHRRPGTWTLLDAGRAIQAVLSGAYIAGQTLDGELDAREEAAAAEDRKRVGGSLKRLRGALRLVRGDT